MKKAVALSKINPVFLNGIAHRGLHNKEFTENGMKAFKNAIDHGVAFEYDIHLTKDGELVVELPTVKEIRTFVREQLDHEIWEEEQRIVIMLKISQMKTGSYGQV